MANKNNNQNELVTTDNDSTAALHGLPTDHFLSRQSAELEEDADTFELERQPGKNATSGIEVIKADLEARSHTIERLQFDVERLRARLSGLDAEINAREQIVAELNHRVADLEAQLAASIEQVSLRDKSIQSLEDEIRDRTSATRRLDKKYTALCGENERLRQELDQAQARLHLLGKTQDSKEPTTPGSAVTSGAASAGGGVEHASSIQHADSAPESAGQVASRGSRDSAYLENNLELVQRILRDIATTLKQPDEHPVTENRADPAQAGSVSSLQPRHRQSNSGTADTSGVASKLAQHAGSGNGQDLDGPAVVGNGVDRDQVHRVLIGRIDKQLLRFPLFKNRLTIGRTRTNDIKLSASSISRRHAEILREGSATRIVDRNSRNGVYVNSRRVKEHLLQRGDRIRIGTAEFIYEERPRRDS